MKYWVCIRKSVPLKEYLQIIWSGFVESDKESTEEVKKSIVEHHKKKGLTGLKVTVGEGFKDE